MTTIKRETLYKAFSHAIPTLYIEEQRIYNGKTSESLQEMMNAFEVLKQKGNIEIDHGEIERNIEDQRWEMKQDRRYLSLRSLFYHCETAEVAPMIETNRDIEEMVENLVSDYGLNVTDFRILIVTDLNYLSDHLSEGGQYHDN